MRKREGVEKERREKKVKKGKGLTPGLVDCGEVFGFNCMHNGSY